MSTAVHLILYCRSHCPSCMHSFIFIQCIRWLHHMLDMGYAKTRSVISKIALVQQIAHNFDSNAFKLFHFGFQNFASPYLGSWPYFIKCFLFVLFCYQLDLGWNMLHITCVNYK